MATTTKQDSTRINLSNSPDVIGALRQFSAAKAAIAEAEAQKEAAEAVIRAALGEAKEGIVRGIVAVKVSSLRTRKSNDAKVLIDAFPEAYEASLKVSTYDFLTVNI